MSLAAVPVFLWGRSLMAPRWALVAAALTLALPGLAYSGLVMTEVVFYPVFVLAAWATAAALVSPTRARQALLVGAVCLAVATRIQAVVLRRRDRDGVRARRRDRAPPAVAARVRRRDRRDRGARRGLARVAARRRAAACSPATATPAARTPAGAAARFVGYHVGDLALLTGVFPACALLVLALARAAERGGATRARAPSSRSTSRHGGLARARGGRLRLARARPARRAEPDRGCAAALPRLRALARPRRAGRAARAGGRGAAAVAVAIVLLPLRKLVVPDALPHAFSLIPLSHLRDATSAGTMRLVLALAVVAAAALFALVPRRALVVLPALLFVALAAGSVSASREVADQARAQQQRLLGPVRRWVDDARGRAGGVRLRRPGVLERGLGEPVLEPAHPLGLRPARHAGARAAAAAAARRAARRRAAPRRRRLAGRRSRSCRCTSRCAASRWPRRASSAPTGRASGSGASTGRCASTRSPRACSRTATSTARRR